MSATDAATLDEARRLWLGGRPLEAGKRLTALIPPDARGRWAGRVLAWAYVRSRVAPLPEVAAVAAIAAGTDTATTPADALAALDAALLRAERSGRFDSLREAVLTLARNATLLLAGISADPPDPRAGWWFVASLKCVGDELEASFAAEAWEWLSRFD